MPVPKKIDDEATYRVTLARPVELAPGVWARPGDEVALKGAVLKTIADKVEDAEPA